MKKYNCHAIWRVWYVNMHDRYSAWFSGIHNHMENDILLPYGWVEFVLFADYIQYHSGMSIISTDVGEGVLIYYCTVEPSLSEQLCTTVFRLVNLNLFR